MAIILGGDSIQQECLQFIRAKGKLMPGQVWTSGSGRLKCKKIIHAVGPRWRGGRQEEDRILYACIDNCFDEALKHSLQSIAIPPISTGIFGYPLPKAVEVIVDALCDRDRTDNPLPQRVIFVDNKDDSLELFKKELEKRYPSTAFHSSQQSKTYSILEVNI